MAILEQGGEQQELSKVYNKLVRDGIPGIIDANPEEGDPVIKYLDTEKHKSLLLIKLLEEGKELTVEIDKKGEGLKEEFADVLEVMNAINDKFEFNQNLLPESMSSGTVEGYIPISIAMTTFALNPSIEHFTSLINAVRNEYARLDLNVSEIENIRIEKKQKRGGFDKGIFLIGVTKK